MPTEGQTAIGPNGQRAVYTGGKWVIPPAQAEMPADPSFPYEGPKAAADAQRAQAGATVDTATVNAEIRRAEAEARIAEANAATAATGEKQYSANERADAIKAYNRALDLDKQIGKLRELYEEGPGQTSGVMGGADYLPLTRNKRFDAAGNAARAMIRDVLGFTGTELNTPKEIELNIGSYIPSAEDRDEVILDKLQQLENIRDSRLKGIAATLGGFPDRDGKVVPLPEGVAPSVWAANRIAAGQPLQAAGAGATTTIDQLPPEMQQEHAAFLQQWMGNPDPQAYAQFRTELDRKHGYTGDPQEYLAGGQKMADAIRQGGATIDPTIPGIEREMSGTERLNNAVVSNPLGAAAVGAADMGSFGGVRALAPEQMGALGAEHPLAMTAGQIGGAITGTAALGRAAREASKRLAPGLLGGGGKAQIGRNLGTDVAYSGAYGGISGEGAGETALEGGVGSLLGQTVGKGIGTAIGGVNVSPAVQYLRGRKIPLTVGQTLGGTAKGIEDAATSVPLVGDMIGRRFRDSLRAFNREALDDAGRPINFTPDQLGKEGVEQLSDAVGNYYDNATAGVSVPNDPQFLDDLTRVAGRRQQLPDELHPRLDRLMENHTAGVDATGQLSGDAYQRAMRGLKTARRKAGTVAGEFEEPYRETVSAGMDAFDGLMRRGGGEDVVRGLDNANAAYRGTKTVEDAIMRADGAGYLATPSQLQGALKKTQRKFPGKTPLSELADYGQEVLPSKLPDSGTARRAIQATLGAGALGGAGGIDYASDGETNALAKTAALLALLTAGGTRVGQQGLTGAIVARPERLKQLGRGISKRKGLFGSAALPLAYGN